MVHKVKAKDMEMYPDVGSVVKVIWVDIAHNEDDLTAKEAEKQEPFEYTTYGKLLVDTPDKITVASTEGIEEVPEHTEAVYRCVTTFPRAVIKFIEEVLR